MCTSIIYDSNGQQYFGRKLEGEISFGEHPVITPRNYVFKYRKLPNRKATYAMIGMAIVKDNYPLYFDAANEKGLGIAGLNFDGPCHYFPESAEKENMTPFELIPYLLSQYASVDEVKDALENVNLVDINFSKKLQLSPLHWLIADKTGKSIVVESTVSGLHVYDNPVHVLTNNPEFPSQLTNLANYANISPAQPKNTVVPDADINLYSRGLGTHHLPGGMDSASRFVKVAFVRAHAPEGKDEASSITNYFHILHSVEQPKGTDEVGPNSYEYTIYSDGTNLETGTFYYTNYENNQINAIKLSNENLDSDKLIDYELLEKQHINYQN